jgi:predicted nucleic acid-binding protein
LSRFVDSSAWYAAADEGDLSNARAREILAAGEPLVTTDHVLVETWLLLHHRLGRAAAERFWEGLRAGAAAIELVLAADLEAAWAIGEAFPDQDFSITDRTSFAVMERLGVHRVASFDDDFAVYRFGRDRKKAFTVLR